MRPRASKGNLQCGAQRASLRAPYSLRRHAFDRHYNFPPCAPCTSAPLRDIKSAQIRPRQRKGQAKRRHPHCPPIPIYPILHSS